MIAVELGAKQIDEVVRAVRALGAHRYVAGRLHLIHAFALAVAGDDPPEALNDAIAWARGTLDASGIDAASRDERLWRRSSDAELVAVLEAFWTPGPRAARARQHLQRLLESHDLPPAAYPPFDETAEDAIHPLTVDAGWELLPLCELDPERHKGAIAAYGDELAFECACFEEETAIPQARTLYELPAIGPAELLQGVDAEGVLVRPLVVWAEGDSVYLDYVMRGVRRAAKLE